VKTDPLSVIGGKGVFTKELEDALFDRRIDLAVIRWKDLATILPEGLTIAAICKRADPRDALVLGRRLANAGTHQSTVCRRRRLWELPVNAAWPNSKKTFAQRLVFRILRGNVDTRLRKLDGVSMTLWFGMVPVCDGWDLSTA